MKTLSDRGGSGARLRVVVTEPPQSRQSVPLGDAVTVGRRSGDIVIADDPYLSGRHLRVRREMGRAILEDLDSTNGVFVRIRGQIELRPGDEIVIGGQVFRFLT
jgi:pSer/pThr/pTyr-binding forkhead associated (FHA) protein